MKEQIKQALKESDYLNTWAVNVRNYQEIEELLEGAVERIEQLEQALEEVANDIITGHPNWALETIRKALGKEN